MATFTICYYSYDKTNQSNERILGTEHFDNIDEILLPINKKNTPIFITKAFTGVNGNRWKVQFVLGISRGTWGVWLTEKNVTKDVYLSETLAKRRIGNPSGLLKKGTIVIVEFGHIYLAQHYQNGLAASSLYPCYHQTGEMHKRRPAIVVSADSRGVRIVPITSKQPSAHEYNRAIVELEEETTRHITEFSQDKKSFVLCELIQTVSPTRILPPDAKDIRLHVRQFRRDESYFRKISKNDLIALEGGLLSAVQMASLRTKHDKLLEEIERERDVVVQQVAQLESLRSTEQQLSAELEQLRKKYQILAGLHLPSSEHTSQEELEQEIAEFLQLD